MHLLKYILISYLLLALSCNNDSDQYPKAENALDAGREFIDGCLKGDFKKAAYYMLDDTENRKQLEALKNNFLSQAETEHQQYFAASILLDQEETLNDTTEIIHYRNSFDKVARKVKIILQDGKWQIDFKYTFNGNL